MSNIRGDGNLLVNQSHFDLDVDLLYISKSKFENDWHSDMHSHHNAEIFVVLSGEGTVNVQGKVVEIKKNDCLVVNPNVDHMEDSTLDNPLEYFVLGINGMLLLNKDQSKMPYHYIANFLGFYPFLKDILEQCLLEMRRRGDYARQLCQNYLEIILIHILNHSNISVDNYEGLGETSSLSYIRDYIFTNYAEDITLDSLAEIGQISKYYLAHSFKEAYSISPIKYLIVRRIEVAKGLLSSSDYQINQIADYIGFSSASYFSQVFAKETGMSPKEFRDLALEQ